MINFKPTIGIEVHTVIKSLSKMFSFAKSDHNGEVNTHLAPIDLGLPGTLPLPNKKVVELAIKLADLLNMEIDNNLRFDRKNYFYQDLPKGFQITQQYYPIGKNGFINITKRDGSIKKINIERIHIEEDTAKQMQINSQIYLNYNRCGMPLIEIVSKPEIDDSYEAVQYLSELKRILSFNEISDSKMEDGSLRADINVSIAPYGANQFGTKVEIKNLNSFNNVAKAIDYEIERQTKLVLTNELVEQQTRKWDESSSSTVFMRAKSDAVDYHYICEPNIVNIVLSNEFVNNAKSNKISIESIKNDLIDKKMDIKIINQILDDFELFKIFNFVNKEINDISITTTWIINELLGILKRNNMTIASIDKNKIDHIIDMIKKINSSLINNKQGKVIIEQIIIKNKTVDQVIEEYNFKQITDINVLEKMINQLIDNNENMLNQYNERPERVEKFYLGLLMKETRGQANPVISSELLKKILINYLK